MPATYLCNLQTLWQQFNPVLARIHTIPTEGKDPIIHEVINRRPIGWILSIDNSTFWRFVPRLRTPWCRTICPCLQAMSILNSSPPSATYKHHWNWSALLQTMACRLFSANPLLNQCWVIINSTLRNNLQWNFSQISNFFIQESAFEKVVCEMTAILSQPQWVNWLVSIPSKGQLFMSWILLPQILRLAYSMVCWTLHSQKQQVHSQL